MTMDLAPKRVQQTTPMGPLAWVLDETDLHRLIEEVVAAEEVVFDYETTGLDEYATHGGPSNGGVAARVVLASFTIPAEGVEYEPGGSQEPTTWVLPLSHPDSPFSGRWRAVLTRVMATAVEHEKPLVGHNVKFDCRWTYAATRLDVSGQVVWDTMVSAHLLDENFTTRLKVRAARLYDVDEWDDFDLSTPGAAERVPLFQLGEYAARDTYYTWRLLVSHRRMMFLPKDPDFPPETSEEVQDARLGDVATWVAMPMVASLTRIEQNGVLLDVPWVRDRLAGDEEGARNTLAEMAERYVVPGTPSAAPTSHWFRAWTEASVQAGGLHVAALTPQGKPQWSRGVLTRQARNGSADAQLVLDHRGHAKRAEFLRAWLGFVSADQEIHANYHPGRVVTGRLSSSNPNMQQVTKSLRPAFIPRPGFVIADFDYSQVELRVAAFISRCQPMIEAFQHGDDLHRLLAAKITGKTAHPEDVTAEERQRGKSANFGLLYGMGAFGFREYAEDVYGVVMTIEEAEDVHRTFFDTWAGMREWHARSIARAHREGAVTSPLGRVRRLPDIWDGNPQRVSHAERNAINSPVQGFASDLMQMAAASVQGILPGTEAVRGVRLIGTVHDSVVAELPEGAWEDAAREIQARMTSLDRPLARMGVTFDVPLRADVTVGSRWGLDDVGHIDG